MNLIFIGSYLNVPCVIDTIDREDGKFRILTENKALVKFFSDLYSPQVVVELPEYFKHFRNVRKLFSDIIKIVRYKSLYSKSLIKLKPKKIFFFFITDGYLECWLINKLSNSTEIYYRPKINIKLIKKTKTIRLILKAFFLRLIFGCSFMPFKLHKHEYIGFNKIFLKKIRAKEYSPTKKNNNIMKVFSNRFPQFNKCSVLFLIGSELYIDINEYKEKMSLIFEKIFEMQPRKKVFIKRHPNTSLTSIDLPKGCVEIPYYYPGNLIFDKASIVISYGSAALFEAANKKKRAISLAFLIDSTRKGQAKSIKNYLKSNSSAKIHFPKKLNDLSELLTLKKINSKVPL